jgi:hypothetical protein
MGPRDVNEDASHELRANGEEVNPVLPIELPALEQAQIGFIHQGRSLKHVTGSLVGHVTPGDSAQLVIDERRQPFQGLFIPRTPSAQQSCDFVWGSSRHEGTRCSKYLNLCSLLAEIVSQHLDPKIYFHIALQFSRRIPAHLNRGSI